MDRSTIAAACAALALAGCGTPGGMLVGGQLAREASVDRSTTYAGAHTSLPPLDEGRMRLHVYRTQAFGGYARPVVVVDGAHVGIVGRPLLPNRSAFVMDVPARPLELWLLTIEETRVADMGRKITVTPGERRAVFVRLALGPTYTYLEPVAEAEAMEEMRNLTFTGFVIVH